MAGMTIVRRAFVAQLNDPFAQVGFRHHQTLAFQVVVEEVSSAVIDLPLTIFFTPLVLAMSAMMALASKAVRATCTLTPAASRGL